MKSKFVLAVVVVTAMFITGFYLAELTIQHNKSKGVFLFRPYSTISSSKIDILHYDLTVDLFPAQKLLVGKAVITGLFTEKNLKNFELDFFDNMNVASLYLNQTEAKYSHEKNKLRIYTENQNRDTFVVSISYEGTPKRLGFASFVFGKVNGHSLIHTLNEPDYAATWFPCNDVPDDKALLDIKIVSDTPNVSVSNGILVNKESNGNRKMYHWKTIYPISTYLICIYSSPYTEFYDSYISANNDTMLITYFSVPENYEKAKIDWEDHPQMIKVFSELFGEYPFIKEKYGVAEFLWNYGAMEHQTITGIGTNFISGKKFFTDTYVHELAHHWWGNAVGPKTWKDIWLNEGFATYSEALYYEYLNGREALISTMLQKLHYSFDGRLYNPEDDLFSPTIYNKGAWVLHMLRHEVGDSSFFRILREYFKKYKYKNASTTNFIEVCETVSGKKLTCFFDHWVYNSGGLINLDYRWKIVPKDSFYILNLEIENSTYNGNSYNIPVELSFQYDNEEDYIFKSVELKERNNVFTFKLDKRPNDVLLDPGNWLFAKIVDKNSYEK
jgi:aminopeptidase N